MRGAGYSHKARVVFEILESYNVGQQHDRLVLVYTGRVQTALELGDVLKEKELKVEVLTGGVSRNERLKLQERLRNREITALVSTRVGEGGYRHT
jgi:superfamily II DNA or RNA helicase